MNTEQRVLAMLNKVQKVREVKKENLGAIEDAVNDAKSNLSDLTDQMVSATRDLELALSVYAEASAQATSNLSDSMREAEGNFYNYQNKAFAIQNELDAVGVQSDNSLDTIREYFDELLSEADSKI